MGIRNVVALLTMLCACHASDTRNATQAASTRITPDRIEHVALGGTTQAIMQVCEHASGPVLLFVHGGPGASEMTLAHRYARAACESFTLVLWDQRGAGRSFSAARAENLTLDRIARDGIELVNILHHLFPKRKIVVAGNSWGSIVGLTMASRAPQSICAYVGVGQFVSGEDWLSETKTCIADVGEKNFEAPTDTIVDELQLIQVMRAVASAGGSIYGAHDFATIQKMREASSIPFEPSEQRGDDQLASIKALLNEILAVDFRVSIPKMQVPLAFIGGEADCVTPTSLAKKYATALSAPAVTIKRAGHLPHAEQPDATFRAIADFTLPLCGR